MALKINSSDPNFYELFERLLGRRATRVEDATKVSADIIGKVRKSGDEALIKLTKELDGLDLTSTGLIVDGDEIDEAINKINIDQYDALKFAADRITAFHLKQMPDSFEYLDEAEVKMGMRWSSVDSVGLYVPWYCVLPKLGPNECHTGKSGRGT